MPDDNTNTYSFTHDNVNYVQVTEKQAREVLGAAAFAKLKPDTDCMPVEEPDLR